MSPANLRNKAKKALLDGKYDQARDFFAQVHAQDPSDIRSFVKLAEMKERTGDTKGAVADYINIASTYAEQGFVVQAIAINKIILRLDPHCTDVKEKLQALSSERGEEWATSTATVETAGQLSNPLGMSSSERLKLGFTRTPLLSSLSGNELNGFIESLELKQFPAGGVIFKEGTTGDYLYLIGMGTVRLQTQLQTGEVRIYSHLNEGDFFGEHAFMSHLSHDSSAIADAETSVLMVDRDTFNQWVSKHPQIKNTVEEFYRQRVLAKVLAVTPLFEGVPDKIRILLAERFSVCRFVRGDIIVHEGERGNTFYLIRSGRVLITTNKMDASGGQVALSEMGAGDFFGEVSLLTNKPRTATAIAGQNVELMELTRENFNVIAQRFPSIRRIVEGYQKKRVKETIKALMKKR
ncbi:MAG: cyclic nucleotide-binding domain-containing protein [Mariprofundaceae bacterium]|nr:cyclic nucleotide-binding domain-containing protein [Mariprofundaceae bacterium]